MKRLLILLAAGLLILVGVATPASAKQCRAAIGEVDVQFNMGVIFSVGVAEDPDTNVSYIGDVTFRGETYVLVWYSVVPPMPAQGQLLTAVETWAIYDTAEYTFGRVDVDGVGPVPGVLTEFDPGELLLAGSDVGYGTPSGRWRGSGPVTEAPADDGPLGCIPVGSRVFWNGSYDTPEIGPGTNFLGKFRVFPSLP
ncbi:MAG: hypothetical protein WCA82_06890 [Jiangellales bacterium]